VLILALVLAGLAALLHLHIFWLESIAFAGPGRKVFGLTAEQAAVMAPWAYNQGFYNLFLAVGTAAGIAVYGADDSAGTALVVFGTASMLGAAVVLAQHDRTKLKAAAFQGTLPALSLLAMLLQALV
jgi:putative membrane protein